MNRSITSASDRGALVARARMIHRRTRRTRRTRRRWQRGQTLVMFALSVTMLVGLAGLAIDVVRAYDLYAREHRAAEAGALAGVLWMPCFYNTVSSGGNCSGGNSPKGQTAVTTALAEVQRNGFGQGVTPPVSCTGADSAAPVAICQTTITTTSLEVTVTTPINVFFLSVLGIQTFNVSATAAADYLSPYILSQGNPSAGGNVWGCGGVTSGNPKCALAAINGPAEFKEQGDPFVYCQEGAQEGQVNGGAPADVAFPGPYPLTNTTTNTVAGFTTNVLPAATPECGGANQDHQPPGFGGAAGNESTHLDLYDFYVNSTSANQTVWIWNPEYDPSDQYSSCQGSITKVIGDEFFQDLQCQNYYTQYGLPDRTKAPIVFNGKNFDDPRMYFNMTYSLYTVSPTFNLNGALVANQSYSPSDHMTADVSQHGCALSYDLDGASSYGLGSGAGTCDADSASYHQWVPLGNVGVGSYRLAVEATSAHTGDGCDPFECGWGRHSYSVAICAQGSTPVNAGGNSGSSCTVNTNSFVSPWNDADLYLNFPGKTAVQIPIAWIDKSFAGRSITFAVFNPGVTHGKAPNSFFTIVPQTGDCVPVTFSTGPDPNWYRVVNQASPSNLTPSCAGVNTWQWVQSAQAPGGGGLAPADFIYHGRWVQMTVQLPASYSGGQWFWDQEVANGAKDFGQICISVSVGGGSPVHLIL